MQYFRKRPRRRKTPLLWKRSLLPGACSFLLAWACVSCMPGSTEPSTRIGIRGNCWTINGDPVLKGSPAEGLLMNVRMVNAVFEDEGPAGAEALADDFDPGLNTNRFLEKLPEYMASGVRAFTISLQGGFPGYEGAVNSAFNADGSLREDYMERVARVIKAADKNGAAVILSCFYQRQHTHARALEGKQALFNAVGQVAGWLGSQRFTNVLLEISNEYAHGGYRHWKEGEWLRSPAGQIELIRHAKKISPGLPVSTSGMGDGRVDPSIARAADFIILHFNNTALHDIPGRIAAARAYGKPVLCNEDDKTGPEGAEAARLSVKAGAGWGFMHLDKNQFAPFRFEGAADDPAVYRMLARLGRPGAAIDSLSGDLLSVLITRPRDGDIFSEGAPLRVQAVLTGADTVSGPEVHFFADSLLIGTISSAPWEITWQADRLSPGVHRLTAVLKDGRGREIFRSRAVDIEIRLPISR